MLTGKDTIGNPLSILTILSLGLIIFGVRLHIIDGLAVSMPYWDDWGIGGFLNNYYSGSTTFKDFFTPVNEHRMLFNRLISVFIFNLNQQQWDPMILMIINSGIWTLCALLLLYIARRYYDKFNTLPFIILVMVVWLYPISPVNTLWGVQTHSYMMIFLSLSGCWCINQKPFSLTWCCGLVCLFSAGLSMAGGSFAAVSTCLIFGLFASTDKHNRRGYVPSIIATVLAAIFGLGLIYLQSLDSPASSQVFNLTHSALTFAKSMSWPKTPSYWPFLIFLIPVLWLIYDVLAKRIAGSALPRFVLSLYLFVAIIAIAVAVARAAEGQGPTRRYFEFLSLGFISSCLALLLIQTTTTVSVYKKILVVAWVVVAVSALPFQVEVTRYTLEDRNNTIPYQTKNVRQYIFQHDSTALTNKVFRHIPFHNDKFLEKALIELEQSDILPYQLQQPEPLYDDVNSLSTFIPSGSYLFHKKISGVDYFGAPMLGSYTANDGMQATGHFTSKPFKLSRPYMMVPSLGFLGSKDLTLTLENMSTGKKTVLVPERAGLAHSDDWLENFYAVTPGNYTLTAEDNNTGLWFGFAAPRTVGRISYLTQQLLERASIFWQIGFILLAFSQRKQLIKLFSFTAQKQD